MNDNKSEIFNKLSQSKFRTSFSLKSNDIRYIKNKGIETIRQHAYELLTKRLVPKFISNDGRQTPMKGHPVFIAQHATATCCRGCLNKWHGIPKNCELTKEQLDYVVDIIMIWIKKEMH